MSIYNEDESTGKLWLRDVIGNIETANSVLSSIYIKYINADNNNLFYTQLTANDITRFDIFYDSIFIETLNGCFFEKISINDGFYLKPHTENFFFNSKKTTKIDYFFDEIKNIIYFVDIELVSIANNYFTFILCLKEFDGDTGITEIKLKERVEIKFKTVSYWNDFTPKIESPKLTYNPDSKNFNVSFIFKNKIKQFGLLSIGIKNINYSYSISRIDGIVQFGTLNTSNSKHYSVL
jgi:hypothetical protein